MKLIHLLLFLFVAGLGCARNAPPPSEAQLRQDEQLEANEAEVSRLIATGAVRAGQAVQELLRLFKPYRTDSADRYTFIEFYPVPNLHGLTLIAVDGKLVSARRWSCTKDEVLFETMAADERRAALSVYESRLVGNQR